MPNSMTGVTAMKHVSRKRFTSRAVAVVVAAASSLVFIGATAPSATAERVATPYAFGAVGYGTLVRGGQLPAGSDMTAFRPIGCTNKAGIFAENHEAASPLGGFGNVSGVATTVTTTKSGSTYASTAINKVANLTLGEPDLGSISIEGITSRSRAWKDDKGYHSSTATSVATITFAPAGAPAQVLDIPTPGEPIEIPGLVRITLGTAKKYVQAGRAGATADALVIDVLATGSKVIVAHTSATIQGGLVGGVFAGRSYASKANALDKNLTSGPTPLTLMGCRGTGGNIQTKKVAKTNLDDQIVIGAATSSQMGKQVRRGWATGWERSSVAEVNLGGGQLVIKGIVGQVNVTRKDGKLTRTITGTTLGSLTIDGEERAFPDSDVIEIPGVAKLERNITTTTPAGISVVSLRITLLDGSGAVIDLGSAFLQIKATGL